MLLLLLLLSLRRIVARVGVASVLHNLALKGGRIVVGYGADHSTTAARNELLACLVGGHLDRLVAVEYKVDLVGRRRCRRRVMVMIIVIVTTVIIAIQVVVVVVGSVLHAFVLMGAN